MSERLDTFYWIAFSACMAWACIAAFLAASGRVSDRRATLMMLSSIVLLLAAGRWPSVFMPGWLNPDESMMLAQALKFTDDPMPWRSMDPGTGGPMNSYLLLPLHWLGMEIGYPLARMTAIACLAAYLSLMFLAFRRVAGIAAAAVVVVPAAMFHAVATKGDMLHYSSELASLLAIGLVAYAASRLAGTTGRSLSEAWWCIATGVCAFVVTMSKLQGVPLGAALSISLVALSSPDLGTFARRISYVSLSAVGAAACLAALLLATGVFADFRISFLELPFAYAVSPLSFEETKTFVRQLPDSRGYTQAIAWLVVLAAIASPAWLRSEPRTRAVLRLASVAVVSFAMFMTLSQPGRGFPHYLSYLSVAGMWTWLMVLPWRDNVRDFTGRAR